MAQREKLKAVKRTVLGKKVKKLRRDEGMLPANIYGKEMNSVAIQLPISEFKEVYKKTGSTGLVDLELDGTIHPTLIHSLQINPKDHEPLHADFFKVNLKEKITAQIPLVAVGEAKAVTDKIGALMQPVNEIEIEALPTDLPEKIEVNVEGLAAVGDQITIEELKAPTGSAILNEPSQVIFKIDELVSKEAEEQAAEEEAAAAESAEAEGSEAPAEDEEKKDKEEETENKNQDKDDGKKE